MAKPIITIIGLGVVGASIGLALQRQPGNFEIVGHDKDPDATNHARKSGAVQRTDWNLHNACDGASMIILALPLNELHETLGHIREDLQPETLIFAVTDVLQPALDLAAELLPAHTNSVAGHPVLTGIGGALTPRADLFDEITFCLATGATTRPEAMQLASDLVERIGAKPRFVDPLEHDGIIAGVEQLPQVLAAVLVQINVASPAWREGQQLAGRRFAQSSELGDDAAQLASSWQHNRTNLVQRIEQLRQALAQWQTLLSEVPAAGEPDPVLPLLEQLVQERLRWEGQAMLKQWDEGAAVPQERVESRTMLQQMFFGGLMGRRGPANDRKPQA